MICLIQMNNVEYCEIKNVKLFVLDRKSQIKMNKWLFWSFDVFFILENVFGLWSKWISWPNSTQFGTQITKQMSKFFNNFFNQIICPILHQKLVYLTQFKPLNLDSFIERAFLFLSYLLHLLLSFYYM